MADKGYDGERLRRPVTAQKMNACDSQATVQEEAKMRMPKPVIYKGRWSIERTFAWLEGFRKLVLRDERKREHGQAFWELGCAILHLRKFTV
ncbi:MAG: transposase [Vampirovibrio sp.]